MNTRFSRPISQRAAISGIGVVSCVGQGVDMLWSAAQSGTSGLREGIGRVPPLPGESLSEMCALNWALLATQEAMKQAQWSELSADCGLILATTTGQIREWDDPYLQFIDQRIGKSQFRQEFLRQPLDHLLRCMQNHFDHQGPSLVVASACAAATQALGLAQLWLEQGKVRRCLVVGVEVLCDLTLEGFRSLQLIANGISRSFDKTRSGINLSEGAAAVCLQSDDCNALAVIAGFGLSTDAYHMTSPAPLGTGCQAALEMALRMAKRTPQEVQWVHAHGTGTLQNDLAESAAIEKIFSSGEGPWVSSTKWLHGHALGASGILETVLIVRALQKNLVIGNLSLQAVDEQICLRLPRQNLSVPLRHVLKSTLGFGGTNAALVISQTQAVER